MKHEKEVTKADERAYDAQNERAEGKSGQAVCVCVLQDEVEVQQPDESNPYEEVYKDSSTFLKVGKLLFLSLSFTHTMSLLYLVSLIMFLQPVKPCFIFKCCTKQKANGVFPLLH